MRKPIMLLSALSLALPALAVAPPAGAKASQYREWTGKDGRRYCRRNNGTTGLIVGGVGGALVGRAIDTGGDRTLGTLGGAALGALAGRAIERERAKKSGRSCR
jgi:uncharacterized protein YcfJ